MGKWAKSLFGQETFEAVGIVVAGTNKQAFEKEILGFFDEVVSSKDSVFHAHLVKKDGKAYPIVFNVYGAPAMVDVLTEMHDGGCRTVLFVGYAYGGFKNLAIATIVVPSQSYHFDGIYHPLKIDKKVALPDQELKEKLEQLFTKHKIEYIEGINVSVPAVTLQLPHANKEYQEIQPATVEMELASCLSRSKDIGMRAVGTLIISDNRTAGMGDESKRKLRYEGKRKVLKTLIDNIAVFTLPPLAREKVFTIDQCLAAIIDDPKDLTNIYKDKG